ncbi:hypothetical protein PG989_002042 [Apiospora arundinis]
MNHQAPAGESNQIAGLFCKLWPRVTDDSNLTLHSFRRFKTTHLLNLRFLEEEIAELDHVIYQAGLRLGHERSAQDRLGLKHSYIDPHPPPLEDTITRELVLKLRDLLQQYDEGLASFGRIMAMETISLLDVEKQASSQSHLSLFEKYNTRLIRIDVGTRSRADPFQRWLHKKLRAFRYWRISKGQDSPGSFMTLPKGVWPYQNTVLIASVAGRIVTTLIVALFLITPLAVLSAGSIAGNRLAVICLFVALFSIVVGATLKVSSYEMMAASAAYAAVIAVFVSSGRE